MPRDKSESHEKVNKAIREEFLEKGYKNASIRSIGARAGMTSAGLYRHYADKEAMFSAMVEPLINSINGWMTRHQKTKYKFLDAGVSNEDLFGESIIDMVRQVILPRRDEFRLLINCSGGTKYENFVHNFVEENQKGFFAALVLLKENGYPVMDVSEEELHMLLSAFITACFEPIVHDFDDAKVEKYLNTVHDFFMPGWMKIMGAKQ